jgi:hypothetical protein
MEDIATAKQAARQVGASISASDGWPTLCGVRWVYIHGDPCSEEREFGWMRKDWASTEEEWRSSLHSWCGIEESREGRGAPCGSVKPEKECYVHRGLYSLTSEAQNYLWALQWATTLGICLKLLVSSRYHRKILATGHSRICGAQQTAEYDARAGEDQIRDR